MTINITAIKNLLEPGINAIFGDYPSFPTEWKEIFSVNSSEKAVETDVEMRKFGLAQLKAEGATTYYDSGAGQRVITSYFHRYVALGFVVTRQAIKDNLYKGQFPLQAKDLKKSFAQTKEVICAAVLNNGFSTSYPVGDGASLFSTSHTIDGGTQANRPSTDVDLNETSIENAFITIGKWRDQANMRINVQGRKLLIPVDLTFVADRLLKGTERPNTANRDVNALHGIFPDGWSVNHYLTDTNAWFIKTDADNGFKYFDREPFETGMYTDPDNQNLKVWGLERYSAGCSNWRAGYASSGAS